MGPNSLLVVYADPLGGNFLNLHNDADNHDGDNNNHNPVDQATAHGETRIAL